MLASKTKQHLKILPPQAAEGSPSSLGFWLDAWNSLSVSDAGQAVIEKELKKRRNFTKLVEETEGEGSD